MSKIIRHDCIYVEGNGASHFICSKTGKPCLCQRWCTAERRFLPTQCAKECPSYQKTKTEK